MVTTTCYDGPTMLKTMIKEIPCFTWVSQESGNMGQEHKPFLFSILGKKDCSYN